MQLALDNYSIVQKVLGVLDVAEVERVQRTGEFEQELLNRFAEAIAKKLPPQERPGIISLANTATNQGKKQELAAKLEQWFNTEELKALFSKTAETFFAEFLQNAYRRATSDQKQRLEELFKPGILKG